MTSATNLLSTKRKYAFAPTSLSLAPNEPTKRVRSTQRQRLQQRTGKQSMARIYVSSTFADLENYRSAVGAALRRLNHQDVAMEYYVAEDMRPVERCLSDVASCDLYIGIFAFRYGYIPKDNNPEGRSI